MTDEDRKARRREYMREYYKANREKLREYNREYMREYRKTNREKLNEYMREYRKRKAAEA